MSKLFRILLVLLFVAIAGLFMVSCDIQKSATKSKSESSLSSDVEVRTFRNGDSVSYRPLILNPKYKDTTIYRVTKNNTRLETVYDSKGNIRDINCYTDKIEELTRRNMQLEEFTKDKTSEKTENFDSSFILYIVCGLVFIVCVALVLVFIYLQKNTASMNLLLRTLVNK